MSKYRIDWLEREDSDEYEPIVQKIKKQSNKNPNRKTQKEKEKQKKHHVDKEIN